MQKLKEIFKTIRNDFRTVVPPLNNVVDEEHHYEVWADYQGKKTFFGRIIMHQDEVELSFFADMTRETMWTLFPGDIFKRMEHTFDCRINDLSPELNANIIEVIDNLIDYFRIEHLLGPQTEF